MSEKLTTCSFDRVKNNIKQIGAIFPNCVTERRGKDGEIEYAVDFDMLRQELSDVIVEGKEERYQFTWPDKKKSVLLANAPISATLRPCREESVDFDTTENLYIEGDNLDVLKLLQETYMGKIKMIYIDPPYNTGNDFVYNDDFAESAEEYLANSGQYDDQGNRLVTNLDSNGRFHTDWLNMIYPRLKIAKDLLTEDGLIFISVDDNEIANLKKICDDIFGASNFLTTFIWEKRKTRENRKAISVRHDYIVCYAKSFLCRDQAIGLEEMTDDAVERYKNPDNDPRGPWTSVPAIAQGGHGTGSQFYTFVTPNGNRFDPPSGSCWRYTWPKMQEAIKDNRIWFGEGGNNVPRIKKFLNEGKQGLTPESILFADKVGTNDSAKRELVSLFDNVAVFETPKPTSLLQHLISITCGTDGIFLDFFSGTASFAQAVISQNNKDSGQRHFILVQLPEKTDIDSEASKAGYYNLCEIGKERIRRAGAKIKEESPLTTQNLDTGFRVLKLDSSNMKDVYYTPDETTRTLFDSAIENIKEDRTDEDLLFQVMLELGVMLSSKIETTTIAGKQVFDVADGFLIACFEKGLTDEIITEIAKKKPYYFVTRDYSMASDSVATNFDQIFATYSPETVRKVL